MTTITDLNEARRKSALAKVFNFSGQIMTLGDYINSKAITRKWEYVQTHETRKINLCYRELDKPVTHYLLCYMENDRELVIRVPKLVYDSFEIQPAAPAADAKERTGADDLRDWLNKVFASRTVDDGNAYIEAVENALVVYANSGILPADPSIVKAFVELDVTLRPSACAILDYWQHVCESMS